MTDKKKPPSISLSLPAERAAVARMYTELTVALHTSLYPPGQAPERIDADLTYVAVIAMLGHAEGRPMTLTEITDHAKMPLSTVSGRLETLTKKAGSFIRLRGRYLLEPDRAKNVPHRDAIELILSRAYAVLGPHLDEDDDT